MTKAIDSNLATKLAFGAAWTLIMRWSVRALGFISTLILARLLTPEDFGIVAMATVVAGLANVLFEFGVATVLVQDPNPKKKDYDTAWSLRLLQASLAAFGLLAVAPLAVGYFDEPRIEHVLWVIAFATAIGGFENIGVVKFQKELDFKSDFQFEVSRKLAQFVITLFLAFFLRSYWALVLGIVVGRASGVAISYWIHPYRPCWDLRAFTKIWSFSRWILLLRIGAYIRNEIDKLVIGAQRDTGTVGYYFLASEMAHIVSTEILAPINRALFPALSKLNQRPETMSKALHLALAAQATVAFPLAVGLAMVADDFVPFILGDQWAGMVPIMQILAWVGVPLCIRYTFSSALTALRRLRVVTLVVWIEIALFLLLVFAVSTMPSILEIALIKIILSMIVSMTLLIYATSLGLTQWQALAIALWRPTAAVIVMASVLLAIQPHLTGMSGIDLALQVTIGGGAYAVLVLALWGLTGCPEGIETLILRRLGWLD